MTQSIGPLDSRHLQKAHGRQSRFGGYSTYQTEANRPNIEKSDGSLGNENEMPYRRRPMRKIAVVGFCAIVLCSALHAQDFPRIEVSGGYSYLSADTNDLSDRQSANGWNTAVVGNINRWVGVEGDVSGHYKSYRISLGSLGSSLGLPSSFGVSVRDHTFAAGPRLNFGPAFAHALFGFNNLSASSLGLSGAQNSFTNLLGGGIQWPPRGPWGIRASADYALTRHNVFGPIASASRNTIFVHLWG
jgi:hypothetical protein